MLTKNDCFIFYRLYWLCCHRAFSFGTHSGDNIPRCQPFVLRWRESIGSEAHHCQPGISKNDTWMTASCKGDIWSDTDMLHYRCNVCSSGVTSAALIPAFILPASPLPNARAVCHGWFGNKMRKVLSQRQKSPFHLALCHPFPLSHKLMRTHTQRTHAHAHTHTQTLMHTCTGQHSVRVFWSLFLHTHTRLHTSNRHSATHTICMLSYPLLLSPLFFLLTYLIPDVSSSLT